MCNLWTLRQSVFKLSTRKRNNEKEQWFFVFPVTKITIVLRTQQMTTGCEFNQVVPLNKGMLVVEFFPVHTSPCVEMDSSLWFNQVNKSFQYKRRGLGKQKEGLFLQLSTRSRRFLGDPTVKCNPFSAASMSSEALWLAVSQRVWSYSFI